VTESHPRSVENVLAVLRAAGIAGADRVRHIPDGARTAAEAAAALGVEVGAIANSLVFVADGSPILVMTSGGHRVDTVALAARIGVDAIDRATPEIVRSATGQAIGGVAPVGHPVPLRTIVDPVLETFPEIWAPPGIRTPCSRSRMRNSCASLAAPSSTSSRRSWFRYACRFAARYSTHG
jgi:prolyl-tRNA editing enzyme YbaK/EbsC (Cys-tRNA(Pro) deacylase)